MSEFKPGEIAIFVGPVKHPLALGIIETGDEVTLLEYDPSDDLWMMDRKAQEGASLWAKTKYLRKRRPPESYKDQFTPASKDFNWREPVKGEVVA